MSFVWTSVRPSKKILIKNSVLRNERKDKCLDQCICLFAQSTSCRQLVVFAVIRRPLWSPTRKSSSYRAGMTKQKRGPVWEGHVTFRSQSLLGILSAPWRRYITLYVTLERPLVTGANPNRRNPNFLTIAT